MKHMVSKLVLGSILLACLAGPACAQNRTATIDLRRVFDRYWKKQQAEAQITERGNEMKKEYGNMVDELKKMKENYQSLLESATDQAASPEERDKRKKAAEDKLKQMRSQEELLGQYGKQADQNLTDQSRRVKDNILKEIRAVVTSKARAANYSLVMDISAEGPAGAPIFLYSNNENDITDAVLQELNATAPADLSKGAEKSGEKKDGKK